MTHATAPVQPPSMSEANAVNHAEYGRVSYVNTLNGDKVRTAFHIVEAADLIISHHLDGRINTAYPQALQPRDRTRFASQLQVNTIAKNLRPEQLADSVLSGEGAPITGRDHIVESGNGRSMGIVKAYASGNADAYKNYLLENANTYGLNRTLIADMARPVLIRVRLDAVDRAQFAKDSNGPDTQNTDKDRLTGFFESVPTGHIGVFSQAKSIGELIRNIRGFTERNSGTLGKWVGQQLKGMIAGRVPVNTGLQAIKSVIGKSKTEFQSNIPHMELFSIGIADAFHVKNMYAFGEDFIKKVVFDSKGFDIKAHLSAYQSANTPIERYESANALYNAIEPFLEKKQKRVFCGWVSSARIEVLSDADDFPALLPLYRDANTRPNELTLSPDAAKSAHEQIIATGQAFMPNFDKALDAERTAIKNIAMSQEFKAQLAGTGLYDRGIDRIITALKNSRMKYGSCNGDGYQQVLNTVYGGMRDEISKLINPLLESTRLRLNQAVIRLTELSPTTNAEAETWIAGIKISKTLINRYDANYGLGAFNADLSWAYRLAGGRISTLKEIKLKSSGRSFASRSGTIALNPQSRRATFAHELGHHFEYSNPKLLEVVKVFLENHKLDDGRPPLIRLSDATGNDGYRKDEIAVRDSLSSPYIGKVYGRNGKVESIDSSEVLSSAFEYLFDKNNGAASMLNNDGLIEFAIGAIKGVYDEIY
ncbi:hypothetical protein [Xenorhabdus sp. PB30.3]|uniref:hypothetical protein n=2 Tax=Xenorhabdus sp. PB30.3 TaxID=2788941 RepID=UPI001E5216FA|nr:hypothetical protein [Xenorhabdus sp. PB30.3]MCC8379134.1 hypothetical protein [Xenorhabdus sp. PB30.3]